MEKPLFTIEDAASYSYLNYWQVLQILGMSKSWVYKWQKSIPGYLKIGSSVKFDSEIFIKELKKRAHRA